MNSYRVEVQQAGAAGETYETGADSIWDALAAAIDGHGDSHEGAVRITCYETNEELTWRPNRCRLGDHPRRCAVVVRRGGAL